MSNPNTISGNKGEQSAGSTEAGHLEVLTREANNFNPEQARKLAERDRPKDTEKTPDNVKFTYLAVMPEKQEKELSPQDAAEEYLSLLDELSKDFTNPTYQREHNGAPNHRASVFSRELAKKYSDNPDYNRDVAGSDYSIYDKTMARIGSADAILGAELSWRNGGEQIKKAHAEIDQKISDLDDEYLKKGRLARFFGKRKYEKTRKSLEFSKQEAERRFTTERYGTGYAKSYNATIAEELGISYDETGNRGSKFGIRGYASREARDAKNEEYNRRFFGLDDPERAAKIERAIELRQKYEAEWSKKK